MVFITTLVLAGITLTVWCLGTPWGHVADAGTFVNGLLAIMLISIAACVVALRTDRKIRGEEQ